MQLRTQFKLNPTFLACSGAITYDLYNSEHDYGESAQISSHPAQLAAADVVTISIGGNDAGFSNLLRACVYGKVFGYGAPGAAGCADRYATQVGKALGWLKTGLTVPPDCLAHGTCPEAPGIDANGNQAYMSYNVTPLTKVYTNILSAAPHAQLIVIAYPHLFGKPTGLPAANCSVGYGLKIDAQDITWINRWTDQLNGIIGAAAQQVSIATGRHISVYSPTGTPGAPGPFAGHGLCDKQTASLNGLELAGVPPSPENESFHPNPVGQSSYDPPLSSLFP